VLTVRAPFAEGVLLETLALSVLNHDSAIASAAARMVTAACGRPCIEMGSRRTHEEAAVAAARAASLVGFSATSNLEAGRRYGVPTTGTSAHAFTLLHDDERAAFRAQVEVLGTGTTLLVDTYDVEQGIRTAVEVAGPGLGGIRLDSGDLPTLATWARGLLDELGATSTRIIVTSDLDEYAIAGLQARRRSGWSTSWSSATACRWRRSRRASGRSAAGSPPSAGTTRAGRRRRRWSPRRRCCRARATATCSCRWCAAASWCARCRRTRRWPRPASTT
jgi:nicotinate phosphoribosyltransferase